MRIKLWELVLMPLLGTLIFVSKLLMEFLPNMHLIAMFITLFTVVFGWKTLIAIYTFVFLMGIYGGFGLWWVPYIYVWTILWAVVMILPKNMPKGVAAVVYMIVCGLHGFLYGLLYAPFQALAFGLDFNGMIAWVIAGLPFDVIHGVSNIFAATLIVPLMLPLKKAISKY